MYIEKSIEDEDNLAIESFDNYAQRLLKDANERCKFEQQKYLEQKETEEFLRGSYSEGENLLEE